MIKLRYVRVPSGRDLDVVTVPAAGEGAISYATGKARPVVEGVLQRAGQERAALAGWSNGYVALQQA